MGVDNMLRKKRVNWRIWVIYWLGVFAIKSVKCHGFNLGTFPSRHETVMAMK